MSMTLDKEQVHRIVEQLPNNATIEDLMYRLYVLETVQQGLLESEAGLGKPSSEIRARYENRE